MNTPGTMTKIGAATQILHGIGAPVNQHTVGAMVGWMNAEGGNWNNNASYNPLNTTQEAPGARPINSVGVKAYNNWQQGISATVQTLKNGHYSGILQALHASDPQAVAQAIGSSPWGTSGETVAQTIAAATGQRYQLPSASGVGARMSQLSAGQHPAAQQPQQQTTDWGGALTQSLLNESSSPIDTSGKVTVHNPLAGAINLVDQNPGSFKTVAQAKAATAQSTQMAGQAVNDAQRAGAPGDAQKLLGMIHAVAGGVYNQANHADINENAAQIKKLGTDCSGLISWLMGPHGLGIWNTSLATPAIADAPGMQAGRGKQITVWNNKQAGNAGHVFIQIGSRFFASEGGVGIREISSAEATNYIQHGSDGGTYEALHPKGA